MQLTASKDFTDKSGNAHKKGERFDVQNAQDAQEYIRNGQAEESSSQQSESSRQGSQGGQRK